MRRLVPVGLAWLIALILVATPLMSAAPLIASAQTEEGTPAAVESPTDAPTEAPTEPVVTETPTAPEATPDTPTDTPTG
jgi:hypothetical protein